MTDKHNVSDTEQAERKLSADATGPAGPAAEAPVPGGVPAEPAESAVDRLEAELDEAKDRYLRLAAEYDNYRKRTLRERAEAGERAQGELLVKVLEALDDLDRLVEGGAASASVADLHQAVTLVDKKLWKELEKLGLEVLDPAGHPFDPALHEAIAQVPAPEAAQAHTVAAVFQVGYRYKGQLLRPARVQVYGDQG